MEQIAKMRAELSAADEAVCDRWLETRMDSRREISDPNGEALKRMVEKHLTEEGLVGDTCRFIRKNLWDLVFLKSEWVIGGDGWAGDSGVGSLLHILSMDENINILVLNNRCFAQTGGQLSKASPWICKPSPAYFHRYIRPPSTSSQIRPEPSAPSGKRPLITAPP